jgi:hypothetical protein
MSKDKEFNIKINGLKESVEDVKNLKGSLDNSKKSMEDQNKTVTDYSKAIREASKEIKAMQGEMIGLDKGSKRWKELAKAAGEAQDRINDAREATRRWASDTKQLDDVINLAKSATAAFTLAKGAMSAFGLETEGAVEAIQKLQGAMAVIQSLQTLQNTLKGSSATATLFNGAMKALTLGIQGTTVATKALRIALMSIGIGIIISLVATLIANWEDLVGWLQKTFPFLNNLQQKFVGLGKAIVNWVTNPIVTLGKVLQKVFSGDFSGALEEAKKGIINQFKGTLDAYSKGYQEAMTAKAIEEENKRTEYAYKMLQAKAGADAKYSKEGIALQKKIFAQRKQMAKGNAEELQQIALDEANYYRECQEYKNKVAKQAADERKRQEREAAAAAKEAARLAKEKAKEEEEARKKAEKEEQERIKNLNDARKEGANAEIEYQKAVLNERKRVVNESISDQEKEEKLLNSQIDKLKQIANNEKLSKKTRREASEQLERATAKLMRVEEDRKNLLDKEAELEKQIVRLNQQKSENAVFDQLKEHLGNLKLTKEELQNMMNMSDEALQKTYGFDDAQVQHVKNAVMQIKTIKQTAETAIADITNKAKGKKSEGSGSNGGSGGGGSDSGATPWEDADWAGKLNMIVDTAVLPAMDTISMFMDFAIEQTQQELDQITELHDKAMDKVNDSADKIRELNAKLKESSVDNRAALQEQLADEQLLYAKRLAEEKKLAEEEKKTKNKLAQQEAKARKVELATQMVMGISNTALGITRALSSFPPPMSFVMAGIVGAMGAIQTALIAAQIAKVKPVKYAEGGILSGPSHSEGGIPVGRTNIEVEGGEMVVSKRNTERYRDVLYKINRNDPSVRYLQGSRGTYVDTKIRKYADGGELNFEAADASLRANNSTDRLMSAIGGIDMHPVVSVVDIASVQDRLVRVRGLAGR